VNERSGCGALADLAPELALGIATGEERGRALEHAAGCVDCRRLLEELSEVADAMLLLVPPREPPDGFETRVKQRLLAGPRRQRRPRAPRRRMALVAAALLSVALLTGSVTAGGVLMATKAERDLAASYQQALQTADGRSFAARNLYHRGGGRVVAGTVFGYAGSPSWVFLTLRPTAGSGPFECVLVLADGRRVDLGRFDLVRGERSWGRTLGVDLQDAVELELREIRADGGGRTFVANLRSP